MAGKGKTSVIRMPLFKRYKKASLYLGVHMLLMTNTLIFAAYITDIGLGKRRPLLRLFLSREKDYKQNDNDENDNPEHL